MNPLGWPWPHSEVPRAILHRGSRGREAGAVCAEGFAVCRKAVL